MDEGNRKYVCELKCVCGNERVGGCRKGSGGEDRSIAQQEKATNERRRRRKERTKAERRGNWRETKVKKNPTTQVTVK